MARIYENGARAEASGIYTQDFSASRFRNLKPGVFVETDPAVSDLTLPIDENGRRKAPDSIGIKYRSVRIQLSQSGRQTRAGEQDSNHEASDGPRSFLHGVESNAESFVGDVCFPSRRAKVRARSSLAKAA